MTMRRAAIAGFSVMALAAAGCGRTVSCEADLGMCHEWIDASFGLRHEIEQAVCRKGEEHFAERPCPRAQVIGVCEIAGGRERTLWYARSGAGDPAAFCRDAKGTFTAGPGR